MVLDHLENAYQYDTLHPSFRKAFQYLFDNDFRTVPNGEYEIEGENVFAIVNSYTTQPKEERFWEAHRKYIDIQYIVSGKEKMGVAPRSRMKETQPYDPAKDFYLLEGSGDEIEVREGFFTIFFPTDVHMPNLVADGPEEVKKVVIKVAVPEPDLTLCFASNNAHKLQEIRNKIRSGSIAIISLEEAGIREDLPEHGSTLEANAWQKAEFVYSKYGRHCFADDTGLEVDALEGRPGVYSARYAGPECKAEDNIRKLLEEMEGKTDRTARFRTVISLIMDATEFRFEGDIKGMITTEPRGTGGFGYDPVFIPEGYDRTFAEMTPEEKNKISHRALAVEKLVRFLNEEILS